jgi:methylenetetrahydrofolate reductase (NADPH)
MHIREKLASKAAAGEPSISFEFFPPKTAQGVQNLYDRMDRMHSLGPSFIDITWGAGGHLSDLTCEMVSVAQSVYGLETCMHLTCTDMPLEKVDQALQSAYKAGCTNILALRGDPPRDKEAWEATENGFRYAKDLVKYIREKYGNHFDIGVGGYPEGADDNPDVDLLIDHLKEKVDAGSTFVITQMFYDVDLFIEWVKKCRAKGINVPIIPGIMPIQQYASFIRRSNWTKARVPPEWMEALEPVKNDDAAVREIGKRLIADMCRKLMASGINHLHL